MRLAIEKKTFQHGFYATLVATVYLYDVCDFIYKTKNPSNIIGRIFYIIDFLFD